MDKKLAAAFVLVTFTSLACGLGGLTDLLPGGGGGLTSVNDLWSDVPRMDGLGRSEMEMPFFAQLLMQTALSQVLAGGTGNGDWAVFSTNASMSDIANYYSNERMAANGWQDAGTSTCVTGEEQGVADVGVFCVFTKESAAEETGLMIIAVPDEAAGQTNLFFIRVENEVTQ